MDNHDTGTVLWLTGLSGSGKSTLAGALGPALARRGHRVEILDGDAMREQLSHGLGFTREDRKINVRRIAFVAQLLARHGITVVVAAISPFRDVRDEVRRMMGRFVEIYIATPLDECVRRDVKGLYARALAGVTRDFTGITQAYEAPLSPEVQLDTTTLSVEDCVDQILSQMRELDLL